MRIYTMAFYREDKIIISSYSKLRNVKNKIKLTSIFVYSFSKIQEIPLQCNICYSTDPIMMFPIDPESSSF